ncbi:unnamed protein product, partial [Phaeothamnion confervicola]
MVLGQIITGGSPIRSMDFHESGQLLVTANEENSISVINMVEGRLKKTIHCQKYGAGIVRYTHHNQSVLVTSTVGNDHAVRYLSLYDNAFLRFYRGHTDKVVSLAMSPVDDRFLTGSADGTVRLWELSQSASVGLLRFPPGSSAPQVAYDPQGLVFVATAAVGESNLVKLYDARKVSCG